MVEGTELISPNNLLILANIILIFIAFLLLIGLRKSKKKPETSVDPVIQPKKESKNELSGIADIKPEEFMAEKFELKKDILPAATPPESAPRQGIESFSTAMKALVEPFMKPEDVKVPDAGEVPNKSAFIEPEKFEDPVPEVNEIDEFELEDELPEMLEAPSEHEIHLPLKEEEKPAEKPSVSPPEPEVKEPVKEEEIPQEEFKLPLELYSTMPEKVVDKLVEAVATPPEPEITKPVVEEVKAEVVEAPPEPEITPIVTEMDKLVDAFTAPAEPEITKPDVEEEKAEEVTSPSSEPEFKLFKHEKIEEKATEEVEAPPEPELSPVVTEVEKFVEGVAPLSELETAKPAVEEEKAEEVPPSEPEFKLFKHEKVEEKQPEDVAAPPELKLFQFDREEKKPEAITAPSELKLFQFDRVEKKTEAIAMPATPDIKIAEKADEPAIVTESQSGAVTEHKEKKAKRKSLF